MFKYSLWHKEKLWNQPKEYIFRFERIENYGVRWYLYTHAYKTPNQIKEMMKNV